MSLLGVISGTISLKNGDLLKNCQTLKIKNDFGETSALVVEKVIVIPRHGIDSREHILPHLINHLANFKALKELGVSEVVGINSTGSLRTDLSPGMIVIPDDFITLTSSPTIYKNKAIHTVPSLDKKVRQKLIIAASNCGIQIVEKGVYWQTAGPRLETRAEIRMMLNYADIIGMTMASEAVVAQELDLPYASACSIDNFGNGLVEKPLSVDEITAGAKKNAETMEKLIQSYVQLIL
jgi:5'-methylthioadenosine phosphorylase